MARKFNVDDVLYWKSPYCDMEEGGYIYRGPDYNSSQLGKSIIYNPKSGMHLSVYDDHLRKDDGKE